MHEMQKEIDAAKGAKAMLSVFENASRVPELETRIEELQQQIDAKRRKHFYTINDLVEMGLKRETARRVMRARGIKSSQWLIEEASIEPALRDLERGSEPLDRETHRRLFELNDRRYRERQAKKKALHGANTEEH